MSGIVGHTGKGAFINHEQREFLGAAAHHLRGCGLLPFGRTAVEKSSGRVVHRSDEHSGEGQGEIVLGRHATAELVVLIAENDFTGKQVLPCSPEASWLISTMKIDH